jgi:hypothetical protein
VAAIGKQDYKGIPSRRVSDSETFREELPAQVRTTANDERIEKLKVNAICKMNSTWYKAAPFGG